MRYVTCCSHTSSGNPHSDKVSDGRGVGGGGCQVAGYAVGGGHVLHMICDLTIAADNAVFGQTGPKVSAVM